MTTHFASSTSSGSTEPVKEQLLERRTVDDLRDRLARAEQDIKNQKENFNSFKSDDFGALKKEVHAMRLEFSEKLDQLLERVSAINVTMAKWLGAGGVLIFVGEILLKKYLG